MHIFHFLTRYIEKGIKESIKRLIIKDEDGHNKTLLDQTSIENELIQHNKKHFEQAKHSEAYKDKIYAQLRYNRVCDKILNEKLRRNESINEGVYNFLKLLKKSRRDRDIRENEITEE